MTEFVFAPPAQPALPVAGLGALSRGDRRRVEIEGLGAVTTEIA